MKEIPSILNVTRKGSIGDFGYTDENGDWVIDPIFDEAGPFSDGLAPVMVDYEWGYIDESGDFVKEPSYSFASKFQHGVAFVSEEPAKYGLIDKSFKWLHEPAFSKFCDFREDGFARVKYHSDMERYGFSGIAWIDRNGKVYDKKPK